MIQDEPYLPGIPSFFPTRPSASVIPLLAFANTIEGNLRVDRRDVSDRDRPG